MLAISVSNEWFLSLFLNFQPKKVRNSHISPEFVSMTAMISAYNLVYYDVHKIYYFKAKN